VEISSTYENNARKRFRFIWIEQIGAQLYPPSQLGASIALSHLIFDGTFDRYPRISGARRRVSTLLLHLCHGGTWGPIKKRPTEYLRKIYYDTMAFSEEGLRHLADEVGADRLMIGTNYLYPWTSTSVEHVLDSPHLSDAQKAAILGGTAATLLAIAAA
jgi:aminocarboxymuconate-semialdehyde decarboxylase